MSEHDERPDHAPEGHVSEQVAGAEPADAATGMARDDRAAPDVETDDGSEETSTGVPAVDDVLASVRALDGRPVEEHVVVFEQAHERLRRALDPGHG